ncbi:hypothetical protein [Kitasatospora sp. NPDC088346]|uniref:hypothetical protein n=1 Tax=Kitasatospora sp. NPDC088346 TaxID=3364073 RepID=UPI0037FB74EB
MVRTASRSALIASSRSRNDPDRTNRLYGALPRIAASRSSCAPDGSAVPPSAAGGRVSGKALRRPPGEQLWFELHDGSSFEGVSPETVEAHALAVVRSIGNDLEQQLVDRYLDLLRDRYATPDPVGGCAGRSRTGRIARTRILVLGGGWCLGPAVMAGAPARGWEVTTFTRGRSGGPMAGTEVVHGDRERAEDLARLAGQGPCDAAVDTSASALSPRDVLAGVRALEPVAGRCVYPGVSAIDASSAFAADFRSRPARRDRCRHVDVAEARQRSCTA